MKQVSFNELCVKHKSDKADHQHGYAKFYERFFERIKKNNKKVSILELGVRHANSTKAFSEYFNKSKIIGVDLVLQGAAKSCRGIADLIKMDVTKFKELKEALGDNTFDIIIDDASHISGHQIDCFENYFDLVNPGGIYIIEDLHTSYMTLVRNSKLVKLDTTNMSFRAQRGTSGYDHETGVDNPNTAVGYFKKLVDKVNCNGRSPYGKNGFEEHFDKKMNIASITFIRGCCIVEKFND